MFFVFAWKGFFIENWTSGKIKSKEFKSYSRALRHAILQNKFTSFESVFARCVHIQSLWVRTNLKFYFAKIWFGKRFYDANNSKTKLLYGPLNNFFIRQPFLTDVYSVRKKKFETFSGNYNSERSCEDACLIERCLFDAPDSLYTFRFELDLPHNLHNALWWCEIWFDGLLMAFGNRSSDKWQILSSKYKTLRRHIERIIQRKLIPLSIISFHQRNSKLLFSRKNQFLTNCNNFRTYFPNN